MSNSSTGVGMARAASGISPAQPSSSNGDGALATSAASMQAPPRRVPVVRAAQVRSDGHATRGRWIQLSYALIDIFLVSFNAAAMFSFRFLLDLPAGKLNWIPRDVSREFPFQEYFAFLVLYSALVVLCCQSQDLYRTLRTRSSLDESLAVAKAVGGATLLLMAFLYLSGFKSVSRMVVLLSGLQNLATLAAWRLWKRQIVVRRVAQGIGVKNVLIVGAQQTGRELAKYLKRNSHLGYVVKGFLDPVPDGDPTVLGRVEDLPQVALTHFADEVFITPPSTHELVARVAVVAQSQRLNVNIVPEPYDGLGWSAPVHFVGEIPVVELHREPIPALGLIFKRFLDVLASSLALVLLFPVLVLLALAIKLDSPGAIFYRSERVGKKGRRFICYKFRSMVADADALKDELRQRNERNGPFFKMTNDPRVTRVGKILRRYSLDELPQFWNVLKGEMSLVGPRPHPLDDYRQYSMEHLRRLDVKPGLTGLWQVTARKDPSFETNMVLDLEYIENWDFWFDMKILLRTLPAILRGEGQ